MAATRANQALAKRNVCRRGHRYTERNTILYKRGDRVYRECRTCKRIRERKRERAKKGTGQNYAKYSACRSKAVARGLPPDDERHGTGTGYTYWKCRCDDCKEWARMDARYKRLRAKAKRMGIEVPDRRRWNNKRSSVGATSLDAVAELRFGIDRINPGSYWDDPTAEEAVA